MSTTVKTTMSKTELAELLVIKNRELQELKQENHELKVDNNRLEIQRNNAYHELKEKQPNPNDIDSIIWYGWNYDYGFIAKCWDNHGSLTLHLEDKFSDCVHNYGRNAFFVFLSQLDNGNREILYKYILKTFSRQRGFK